MSPLNPNFLRLFQFVSPSSIHTLYVNLVEFISATRKPFFFFLTETLEHINYFLFCIPSSTIIYGLYHELATTLIFEHLLLKKLTVEFSKLSKYKVHKGYYKWLLSAEDFRSPQSVLFFGGFAKICKLWNWSKNGLILLRNRHALAKLTAGLSKIGLPAHSSAIRNTIDSDQQN